MTTIFWKAAAPFGTSRSRYKARRAAAVAARQREKKLMRAIGDLLVQEEGGTLSQKMRRAFPAVQGCPQCGLPGLQSPAVCAFCNAASQQASGK